MKVKSIVKSMAEQQKDKLWADVFRKVPQLPAPSLLTLCAVLLLPYGVPALQLEGKLDVELTAVREMDTEPVVSDAVRSMFS